jgi:hypothetical protein
MGDFFLASPGVSWRSLSSPDLLRSLDPKFILAYIFIKGRLKYKKKKLKFGLLGKLVGEASPRNSWRSRKDVALYLTGAVQRKKGYAKLGSQKENTICESYILVNP